MRRSPATGWNERATQPAALLPRALKGWVDFGAGQGGMGSQFHGGRFVLERGLLVEKLVDPDGQRESRAIQSVILKPIRRRGTVLDN